MAGKDAHTIPIVNDITISDICGLLEVNRICDGENKVLIPWLSEKIKYGTNIN